MGRFINNVHVVKMFVPKMAEENAADPDWAIITQCDAPTKTEERDNRSKHSSELFV